WLHKPGPCASLITGDLVLVEVLEGLDSESDFNRARKLLTDLQISAPLIVEFLVRSLDRAMNRLVFLLGISCALLAGGVQSASPGYTLTTSANDPLVKQLEARLDTLGRVAAKGDLVAARALRSAAANKRFPM